MIKHSFRNLNLINDTDCFNIEAYYYTNWKKYSMKQHFHNQIEIMYVLNGCCKIEISDKIISLKPTEFIIIDGNIPHCLLADDCRMFNIEFTFKPNASFFTIKQLLELEPDLENLFYDDKDYWVSKDVFGIGNVLKNIILLLPLKNKKNLLLDSYIVQLLVFLSKSKYQDYKESNYKNSYYEKALEYINTNYDQDIKVEDIASFINISTSYLHKIFKNFSNMTPTDYITKIRLEKSKHLLRHTDYNISEIALLCGFSNLQYFSYSFKKQFNLTPKDYKNKNFINSR